MFIVPTFQLWQAADCCYNKSFQYESPTYKSDTLRVKAVIVNPTQYWVYPRLKKWDYKKKEVEINPTEFSGNDNSNSSPDKFKYRTVPSPYSVVTTDAEFDQGKILERSLKLVT